MKVEYSKELNMKYSELCTYLQNKYGMAVGDYYHTPECKTRNRKVTRTGEGLFCHHIMEDRYGNLGNEHIAKYRPFEAQKKENLVYCNYMEHLILHLKINANSRSSFECPSDINLFFNSLGYFWIASDMHELYKNNGSTQMWRNNCYSLIIEDFDDFVSILKGTLCFVEDNYNGDKKNDIKIGDILTLNLSDIDGQKEEEALRGHKYKEKEFKYIVLSKSDSDEMVLKKNEGLFTFSELVYFDFLGAINSKELIFKNKATNTLKFKISDLEKEFVYKNKIAEYKKQMAQLNDQTIWDKMEMLLDEPYTDIEREISKVIKSSLG